MTFQPYYRGQLMGWGWHRYQEKGAETREELEATRKDMLEILMKRYDGV